jgi:hypothetical protein
MDPSDHDAAASQARKRAKPPVIELEATDVTPERPKQERSTSEAHQEEGENNLGNGQSRSSSADPRNHRAFPILSGFIGMLVGALALALVFLFVRGGSLADITGRTGGSDPAIGAIGERVDQLLKIVAEQEKRLASVESRPAPQTIDLAPLTARVESMENSLSDLRKLGEQAQAASAAALEAVQGRIAALEGRLVAPPRPAASNAAEIVALGALRDAVITGASFEKELAAVRSMLGDRAALLAPFAQSARDGLPTVAKLSARFAGLAPKLAREQDTAEGYLARLWANAVHLVEVRPAGEVEGTSAGAIVARMEERLKRGDLAAALEEGARLPLAARTIGADWIALAARRRDAELAVKNLLNAELATLAAEPQK